MTTHKDTAGIIERLEKAALDAIPSNWLDPLLTGPNKVLPDTRNYTPADIERLLNAIRERVSAALRARTHKGSDDASASSKPNRTR